MHATLRTLCSYLQTRISVFESDCLADEWLLLGSHTIAQRSDAAGEPQTGAGALRLAAADGAPCPPRAWGSRWQFTNMLFRRLHTVHSDCLSDIVRMCTVASRCGVGNIVWLGYDCAAFNALCQAKSHADLARHPIGRV